MLRPGEEYICSNTHDGFVEGTSIYRSTITFPIAASTENQVWKIALWWEADVISSQDDYIHEFNCSYMTGNVTMQHD